jgi:hypothetical protein
MPAAPESVELELPEIALPMRPRPPLRRRDSAAEELQPTRSGRSLENRAVAEIAALKAKIGQQHAIEARWKNADEELAAQKQARATDALRVAEQIAMLESRMQVATSDAARAFETVSKQRNVWRRVAVLAAIAAVGFLGAGLRYPRYVPRPVPVGYRMPQAQASVNVTRVRHPLPRDPEAALGTALARLNGALETVPQRTPEETLKKVTAEGNGCTLVWTNDLPSIIFGTRPGPNSIAMTLEECAEAVEDLR